ncbi:MAG: hypothetical protein MUE46_06005 [Xanthomonadales bacterium]|jgi:hypothetical protein|nr:hypothetical protein [Xanthomonadales bacterium]
MRPLLRRLAARSCGPPLVPADLRLTVGDTVLNDNACQALEDNSFTATGSILTSQPGFASSTDFQPRFDSLLRNGSPNLSNLVTGKRDLPTAGACRPRRCT